METVLPGRPKLVFDGEPPEDHPPLLYLPLDPGYSTVPVLDNPPKKE